ANTVVALALAESVGVDKDAFIRGIADVAVPGRMQAGKTDAVGSLSGFLRTEPQPSPTCTKSPRKSIRVFEN
ncbi:hypothetical protein ACQX0S_11535, partial [Corynebacterium diphtheriae]